VENKKNTLIDTDFVEKILDLYFSKRNSFHESEGFVIVTDKNKFTIRTIDYDARTDCYLICEDDFGYYKNSILYDIEIIGVSNNTYEYVTDRFASGGHCFVNIITSKGQFQLTSYDQYNGFYGGTVEIYKNDKIIEEQFLGQ
jgi:hypothetical protein